VVQSEVKGKAYFGDLHANIAIRSGAVGAVVDSFTGDSVERKWIEFSVFAKGVYSATSRFEHDPRHEPADPRSATSS